MMKEDSTPSSEHNGNCNNTPPTSDSSPDDMCSPVPSLVWNDYYNVQDKTECLAASTPSPEKSRIIDAELRFSDSSTELSEFLRCIRDKFNILLKVSQKAEKLSKSTFFSINFIIMFMSSFCKCMN